MTYNPRRPASILFDYWPESVEWFIVGGPADVNDAQTIHRQYPDVKCIGFEPNPDYVQKQMTDLEFPGTVHEFALWSENKELTLTTPKKATAQGASICRPNPAPDMSGQYPGGKYEDGISYQVQGRTLDSLSEEFGPFDNAVLWIDIEYAEIDALKGAAKLLSERRIKLINAETFAHLMFPTLNRMLTEYGFMLQKVWNMGTLVERDAQDVIYLLGE